MEFQKGRVIRQTEREIERFLKAHRTQAFTVGEIARGIGYVTGTNVWNDLAVFLAVQNVLETLTEEGKAASRMIAGQQYYAAAK